MASSGLNMIQACIKFSAVKISHLGTFNSHPGELNAVWNLESVMQNQRKKYISIYLKGWEEKTKSVFLVIVIILLERLSLGKLFL